MFKSILPIEKTGKVSTGKLLADSLFLRNSLPFIRKSLPKWSKVSRNTLKHWLKGGWNDYCKLSL